MPRFNHTLLARARTELGLTQEQAALAVEVDVRTYRRYESGAVNAGADFHVRNASRRGLIARMCREFGLAEAELVAEEATWGVCHAHTLARAPHFVGREEVLARLDGWGRGVLALVAVGGAGKTAVVERWLARLGEGPRRGGVFVWSFYEDARVEVCVARALEFFAPGVEAGPGERQEALQAALGAGAPHVLVLDGLEVVQGGERPDATLGRIEDGALRRLLMMVARGLGRARVLVTTRVELGEMEAWEGEGLTTVRLGDLSEGEGRSLLERWGICGDELEGVVAGVGGHALSVAMLGSYGAFLGGQGLRGIAVEPAARDDVRARRLLNVLSAYARALAPAERDVLARVALFPAGVDAAVLGRIAAAGERVAGALAGIDAVGLAAIVGRLERLGLVARTGGGVAAHPFVAEYFRSLLGEQAAAVHEVERRHVAARLDRHGSGPLGEDLLDTYEALLGHTLRAGDVAEALAIYTRAMGGYDRLGLRLGAMSRGLRVVRMFAEDGMPERVARGLEVGWRARLLYEWSLYAGALGDLEQAIACLRIHGSLVREAGSLGGLTTSLRTLAYDVRLTGALDEALALARAAVEVAARAGSTGDVVRGVALIGRIEHDRGDHEAAVECFARARAMGDRPFARRALWEAECLLERGEVDAARREVEANLAGLQALGWGGHLAHARTLLGLAALADGGDVAHARGQLDAAYGWTAASGEVEVVLRCHELAALVARHEGRPEVTQEELRRGQALAEVGGFGLYARRLDGLRGPAGGASGRPG
ncbi:MAG: helix-turn-helix domain-containing protein [Myxococcales bacterium]|nr:helix-turn-helix domain-containing protein [Myxococcales bacterium]